ncbi:MAG TPA: hypothetical protein VFZ53_17695 [Polyangiaceae bacterium]
MNIDRALIPLGTTLVCLAACGPPATDEPPPAPGTGGVAGAGGIAGGADSNRGGGVGGATAGSDAGGRGGATPSTGGSDGGIAGGSGATAGSGGMAGGGDAGAGGRAGSTAGGAGYGAGAEGGSGAGAGPGTGGAPSGGTGGAGCPGEAFLCEGFETYTEGAAPAEPWTRDVRGAGRINVESSRPFSGTKALHVTGTMNADRANIKRPLAITANTVFVRFMMYTIGYPSSSGVHTRLMRLGTSAGAAQGTPDSSYSFASYNGTAIEKVNSIYLRNTATKLNDSALKNRWVCWEFAIDKTGGVGKVAPHVWLDGRELALAAAGSSSHGMTSPSWDPIPIEVLILGLDGFQSDAVRGDFWIDDVVIASQRVGCPTQ